MTGCHAYCVQGYLTCCGCCLDRVYSLVKSNAHSAMYMYGYDFFEASHLTHQLMFKKPQRSEFEISLNNFYWMIRLELCLISSQICLVIVRGIYKYESEITGFLLLIFVSTYILGAFLIQTLSAISTGLILSDIVNDELQMGNRHNLKFIDQLDGLQEAKKE